MSRLEDYIISIPDFPKKGINFRDVTGILDHGEALRLSIDMLKDVAEEFEFDAVAGVESRGFIFGTPLAYLLGVPFIPVRKAGKLPRKKVKATYQLEYGEAAIEIHEESVYKGMRILLLDDLLATGGTLEAAAGLIEELGGIVTGILSVIELSDLGGRKKLEKYEVRSLVEYAGE